MELLKDVRIVAFSQFLLGPAATQYLADLGADVIKIEAPTGAFERKWSGGEAWLNGESVFYLLANRNVRSVTLDLKHPDGRAAALRLVAKADVVLENFRPGVLERLGLGWEELTKVNPALIYASGSGYGSDGPFKHLPGQDLLLQALTGLATITGSEEAGPTPAGAAIVDQHAATLLALGVLAALHARDRTGEGQRLEVTMVQAALDLQMEPLAYRLNGGTVERPRSGLASGFHEAPYGIYLTADGYLAVSLNPMRRISAALGDPPQLAAYLDESLAFTEREAIYLQLAPLLADRPTAELIELLQAGDVWCAPVNDHEAMLSDPVLEHIEPFVEIDHPTAGRVTLLKHPINYSSGRFEVSRVPPQLGQDTEAALAEVGYSPDEIESLRAVGAA